jgi:predicted metal-dependent phosphotriesterase family hydrolase
LWCPAGEARADTAAILGRGDRDPGSVLHDREIRRRGEVVAFDRVARRCCFAERSRFPILANAREGSGDAPGKKGKVGTLTKGSA